MLVVAVVFLNEEAFLPKLLDSIDGQTRLPDRLLLVDDGSDDASPAIAAAFAEGHAYTRVMRRPERHRQRDRLATAAELQAFQWAVSEFDEPFDIIAKLDGDLELPPDMFAAVERGFDRDPGLGIAGTALSVSISLDRCRPERSAPWHVRGATKFYRRACWEQISPLPTILGWDTIDEARGRIRGWGVENVTLAAAAPLHLRDTGTYDGVMRGFRRRGIAAWSYGADPLNVLVSSAVRMRDRPFVMGGLSYLGGWLHAASRRDPRAEPEVLRFVRREQRARIARRLSPRRHG
jgi:glycosyltransferase involved in cell wall biosynthesis